MKGSTVVKRHTIMSGINTFVMALMSASVLVLMSLFLYHVGIKEYTSDLVFYVVNVGFVSLVLFINIFNVSSREMRLDEKSKALYGVHDYLARMESESNELIRDHFGMEEEVCRYVDYKVRGKLWKDKTITERFTDHSGRGVGWGVGIDAFTEEELESMSDVSLGIFALRVKRRRDEIEIKSGKRKRESIDSILKRREEKESKSDKSKREFIDALLTKGEKK